MSLTANALVTLDQVYGFLDLGEATHGKDGPNLELAIESVSAAIRVKVNCDLASAAIAYTAERVDGSGSRYLYLPHWPVIGITALTEDDVAIVENTDYYQIGRGVLERVEDCRWTRTRNGIAATYTAGYLIPPAAAPTLPADLKTACLVQVADMFKKIHHKSFGETSRTIGGQTITYSDKELLPFVEETLKRYWREEY